MLYMLRMPFYYLNKNILFNKLILESPCCWGGEGNHKCKPLEQLVLFLLLYRPYQIRAGIKVECVPLWPHLTFLNSSQALYLNIVTRGLGFNIWMWGAHNSVPSNIHTYRVSDLIHTPVLSCSSVSQGFHIHYHPLKRQALEMGAVL